MASVSLKLVLLASAFVLLGYSSAQGRSRSKKTFGTQRIRGGGWKSLTDSNDEPFVFEAS